jgi:hypothetical protein
MLLLPILQFFWGISVPPNLFWTLVCRELKKVENHWCKQYLTPSVSVTFSKTQNKHQLLDRLAFEQNTTNLR